jgi:hypothetical protein
MHFVTAVPTLAPHAIPTSEELQRLRRAWYQTARRVGGACLQRRHGERGNLLSELWLFHPSWWRNSFTANGFTVVHDEPMQLFYTGNMLLGPHLDRSRRTRLARWLGSACHLYKVTPAPSGDLA